MIAATIVVVIVVVEIAATVVVVLVVAVIAATIVVWNIILLLINVIAIIVVNHSEILISWKVGVSFVSYFVVAGCTSVSRVVSVFVATPLWSIIRVNCVTIVVLPLEVSKMFFISIL